MQKQDWKKLYGAFNPTLRVEVDEQDRFVVRPRSLAARVIEKLDLDETSKFIFCGSVGSGKSSELAHLASELQREWCVVGVDLAYLGPDLKKIRGAEILVLLGGAVLETMREGWGMTPSEELSERLKTAFTGLLEVNKDSVDWPKLLAAIGMFAFSMKTLNVPGAITAASSLPATIARRATTVRAPSISGTTRWEPEEGPDMEALVAVVNDIILEAQAQIKRQVILLVDGLDKIADSGLIKGLFTESRLLCRPLAPIVFSAPVNLMREPEYALLADYTRLQLFNLVVKTPAIPNHQVEETQIKNEREVMRNVIQRRITKAGYTLEAVFEAGIVDRIIDDSGGVLRRLVELVQHGVAKANAAGAATMALPHVEAAVSDLAGEKGQWLTGEMKEVLRQISSTGELPDRGEVVDHLTAGHMVLPYKNGRPWWGLTPEVTHLL